MPRPYEALLSDDPAWPDLAKQIHASPNRAVALVPPSDEARRACLTALQVTTRSTLGALAHETGGVLVDGGWLRLLGAGCPALPRVIGAYNQEIGVPMSAFLVVGDDVVGGVFAINAGALGPKPGHVYYFAPDSLEWEDTDLGHGDFIGWALEGDLEKYYRDQRWSGWERDVGALVGDRAISMHPPLWAEEARGMNARDRRAVPATELWALQQKFAETMGRGG